MIYESTNKEYKYVLNLLTYKYVKTIMILMLHQCFKCLEKITAKDYYGLHAACFKAWFGENLSSRFEALTPEQIIQDENLRKDYAKIDSSFFQGKYKKYSATLNSDKYIFKINDPDFPFLQRAEYLSNQIAEILHVKVAEYFLIRFEGQDCFVTRNFLHNSNYRKLTHLYHYLNKGASYDVDTLAHTIFEVTKKPKDVDHFLKTILFDSLIGNHDRHGRNLGFLVKGLHHFLSPIYDNCSYIGIETKDLIGADLNPLGKVSTLNSEHPSMKDYCLELIRMNRFEIMKSFKRACNLEKILKAIETSFLPEKYRRAFSNLIQKRHEEFREVYESRCI
jgi:hypothetical protein